MQHTYDTAGRDGTPFSLILLDVDNFKAINDGFGHSTGDLVLKGLGEIVRSCVRETDTAARFGGEEVLILLPHTGPEAALLCAHRMRRALEQAQWPHGRVTASFGVATHVSGSGSLQNLLRDVDQAMYQAKRTGKNKVVRQGRHDADPDHPSHRRCSNIIAPVGIHIPTWKAHA